MNEGNIQNKKKLIIGIISVIVFILGSVVIYNNAIKPSIYKNNIKSGNEYLLQENYEEAIISFEKAIKAKEQSTEARLGAAKGYIGTKDIDAAIVKLQQAQNIDIKNEKLLQDILAIIKEVNPDAAFSMILSYFNSVGEENISDEIMQIFVKANEMPGKPKFDLEPGVYDEPITIKLSEDNINLGHSYYYTTDGTRPNKGSNRYSKEIKIDKTTEINIVGYNVGEKSTEVYTYKYYIGETPKLETETSNIESVDITNKTWTKGDWVLYITDSEIVATDNFHEGYRYNIISKNMEGNNIVYQVSDSYSSLNISISVNDNVLNISSNDSSFNSYVSGSYYLGDKNKVIGKVHESQFLGSEEEEEEMYYCVDYFNILEFDKMGISLDDVKNYYNMKY